MKQFLCLVIGFGLLGFVNSNNGVAQEQDLGLNPNSIRPIHEDDIMYKKRVWRRMDLKEKQNKGFFASGNEITKIMIVAVKQGLLYPYITENDSLNTRLTKEDFLERLRLPEEGDGLTEEEKALGFTDDDGGFDDFDDGFDFWDKSPVDHRKRCHGSYPRSQNHHRIRLKKYPHAPASIAFHHLLFYIFFPGCLHLAHRQCYHQTREYREAAVSLPLLLDRFSIGFLR